MRHRFLTARVIVGRNATHLKSPNEYIICCVSERPGDIFTALSILISEKTRYIILDSIPVKLQLWAQSHCTMFGPGPPPLVGLSYSLSSERE